ncbi:dienelactone hydrolase family protein [Thermopolyspora sp. NPDC052614]|uniref:dienelactone hydrolase family protein n=1 Tax=Thermopolyspora sp. NPDC052614 TaxID=3155682 RepID=UPI003447764A
MCYDSDATPPVPAAPRMAATAEPLTLTSGDGARFAAHLARPERPSGTAVLILPDNRGLSGFYQHLAVRLAEQGHTALAIDYYGRTAGTDIEARGEDFGAMENLMPNHISKLTPDTLYGDILAAADVLRSPEGGGASSTVSLGFCMGGRFAFLTAASRFGFDGVIGFYGFPDVLFGAPGPTQRAAELTAPVLGLFGGADEGISPEVVAAFGKALTGAGVEHEFVTYPGAPHGFFDQGLPGYEEACADAWRRVMDFIAVRGGAR